jgi:hypothetical protein
MAIIDADKLTVAVKNNAGDYKPDSMSACATASQSLFVLRRCEASRRMDRSARPRVRMIIMLWATWVLVAVAYLMVNGAQ